MGIKIPSPEPQFHHPAQLPLMKLREATSGLHQAEEIWRGYMARRPLRLEMVKDNDQHTIEIIVRLDTPLPAEDLSRLLRNCVNGGRSALDNLITRLARDRGATEKQLKQVAFPVVATEAAWKNDRWGTRLGMLSDVVVRVRRVQPLASREAPGPAHPLVVLHELWNADKHRGSFGAAIGLSPQAGETNLFNMSVTVATEHVGSLGKHLSDVDSVIDLDLGPIEDGTRLMTIRLPKGVNPDDVTIEPADVPFTMGLVGPAVSITDSAIAVLGNALRYARDTVRFVSGISDELPKEYPPGLIMRRPEPA